MTILEAQIIPIIDRRFALSRRDTLPSHPIELPKIQVSSITHDKRRAMLDMSIAIWNSVYSPEEFQGVLGQEMSQQQRDYLKRVRKYGIMMRTSYSHLAGQELPPSHRYFVWRLGILNDNYYTNSQPALREELHQIAKATPRIADTAKPAILSDEDFRRKMQGTVRKVQTALNASELPFEDFHDLRKKLRHLQNVILLFNLLEGESPDLEKIHAHGANFITRMGDITDDRYANHTTDKPVQITPSLKDAIGSFVNVFEF